MPIWRTDSQTWLRTAMPSSRVTPQLSTSFTQLLQKVSFLPLGGKKMKHFVLVQTTGHGELLMPYTWYSRYFARVRCTPSRIKIQEELDCLGLCARGSWVG